jgi:guanylate kinase
MLEILQQTGGMSERTGILLVVSGPSGAGKSTLCKRLAAAREAHHSISCTTREPRSGEVGGVDYHFVTGGEFADRLAAGEFLEHALVHGNCYGTLREEVMGYLAAGTDVVMDIDVQGAAQVRACAEPAIERARVDVFVMPPSEAELHARLAGRGTDSEAVIALRMQGALEEIRHWPSYTYRIMSASRDDDYRRFTAILTSERLRVSRLR